MWAIQLWFTHMLIFHMWVSILWVIRESPKPIDDFALAFVAPLSADHNYILGHEITLNEQIDGGSEPPIGCPQKQGSSCGLEMD